MTDRELMQMALDALNQYINVVTSDNNPERWAVLVDGGGPARTAISALRDRLAQSEREWVSIPDWEIHEMYNEPKSDAEMIAFAREFEAKLKDKNT